MKTKPKEMSVSEYNALLMEDAFKALSEARGNIMLAQSYAEKASRETDKVVDALRTVYKQMRLDI